MNLPIAITILRQLELKKPENYVKQFEEVLTQIVKLNDPNSIVLLCNFFDDSSEFDELMFSIIHSIEIFDDTTYVAQLIKATPQLYMKSPRWASIIFMRVLNSLSSSRALVDALRNVSDQQKKAILDLMQKINSTSDKFLEKTQPIVEVLS